MAPNNEKATLGALGEELGCRYLKNKGYKIIEKNYKNALGRRLGEIDIVAQKGDTIVFVEVKTRLYRGEDTPLPEQNITHDKLKKLSKIALHYLRERKKEYCPYTFDALAIFVEMGSKKAKIRHLESIFL